MGLLASVGVRTDPVLNHNFLISLIDTSSPGGILGSLAMSAIFDVLLGGFTECSGLEMSLQVEEYKEGGKNDALLKFPSRVTWGNLTLRRGVSIGTTLWDWHYGFVEGTGKRRDGVIVLMNDLHLPNNIWYFRRGLPVRYTGPTMNAGQSAVSVESLEIAHEGMWQVPYVGLATGVVNVGLGFA